MPVSITARFAGRVTIRGDLSRGIRTQGQKLLPGLMMISFADWRFNSWCFAYLSFASATTRSSTTMKTYTTASNYVLTIYTLVLRISSMAILLAVSTLENLADSKHVPRQGSLESNGLSCNCLHFRFLLLLQSQHIEQIYSLSSTYCNYNTELEKTELEKVHRAVRRANRNWPRRK